MTGEEFSCNCTVSSLLLRISHSILMIKTGFPVCPCSWADSVKDRFYIISLSSSIRELELVFKEDDHKKCTFPRQKVFFLSAWESIRPLTGCWLCVSLGGCLPLEVKRTISVVCTSGFALSWGVGTWKAWFLPDTECLLQGIECPPILCSQKGLDCSWHQADLDPEDHR